MDNDFDMDSLLGCSVDTSTLPCRLGALKKLKIDFDVHLESYGVNLQRPFVWTIEQQSAFIESIAYHEIRQIPLLSIFVDDREQTWIYKIVDGRQRLQTCFNWLDDKVPLTIQGQTWLRSQMPENLREHIEAVNFSFHDCYDMSDRQLIEWFNRVNFLGTPQDEAHKQTLLNLIKE